MQVLSRRERRVIELRYGLAGGVRKTQREISKALGISRSYVSRIEKRAITKLQNAMAAEGYQWFHLPGQSMSKVYWGATPDSRPGQGLT